MTEEFRKPSWNSAFKTHTKSMKSSQGKSIMDIQTSKDMDRPAFYFENIVYHCLANETF